MQSYEQLILHNYAAIVTYIADNRIQQFEQDLLKESCIGINDIFYFQRYQKLSI